MVPARIGLTVHPSRGRRVPPSVFPEPTPAAAAWLSSRHREILTTLLSARIRVRCVLSPLDREELEAYVGHHLATAGLPADLFTSEALDAILAISGGAPRMINLVCGRALHARDGAAAIDAMLVQRWREVPVNGAVSDRRRLLAPRWPALVGAGAALVVLLLAAAAFMSVGDRAPGEAASGASGAGEQAATAPVPPAALGPEATGAGTSTE